MRIRLLPVCVASLLLPFVALGAEETPVAPPNPAPIAVPDAAQMTAHWRAYFQSLQSLRLWSYNAQMQLWEKDAKQSGAAPHLVSDIKIRFANASPWFYREMQVRESEKVPYQVVMMAYDGKKYQMAVNNPQPENIDGHPVRRLMQLAAKPFAGDPTTRTNFHLPLAMPFIFVSDSISDAPLTQLQKPEFWADVQKRITKITPDSWQGHDGYTLTVTPQADAAKKTDERTEVFVDEASSLPLHLTNFDNKTQKIIGEIKVTALRAAENGAPALPLRIELSGESSEAKPGKAAGKIAGTGVITVDPASVSMNAPMDSERFTIPFSSMEFVIENDKVVYSSFAKATSKTAAKAPAKTSAKATAKPK